MDGLSPRTLDGLMPTPLDGEILPPERPGVRLSCCPNPFSNERLSGIAMSGMSIGEIVRMYARHDVVLFAHVWVANADMTKQDYVDAKYWEVVRPKAGALVTIRMIPQGGGGGGKSPLRMIAMLAVAVLAAWGGAVLAPMLTGALGFSTAVGSTAVIVAGSIISGAITMIGTMLVNALIPPPNPNQNQSGYGGVASSPNQAITGTQNRANIYGAVPRVFGKVLVNPPYAGAPYDEWNGQTQYCRLLFDFGYGPLQLTNVSIGTTLLSEYIGVNFDIRGGQVSDNSVSSDEFQAIPSTMNTLLPWDVYVTQNTASNVNGATFKITFPSGLGVTATYSISVTDTTTGVTVGHFWINISPSQLVNNVYDSSTDSNVTNFTSSYAGTFQFSFLNFMTNAQATQYPSYLTALVSITNAGLSDSSPIGIYSNVVHEISYNIKLTYNNTVVVTTNVKTDEISFDLSFTGLCTFDANGNATTNSVGFNVIIVDHVTQVQVGSSQFSVSAAAATTYVYSGWDHVDGTTFQCPYTGQFDVKFTRLKPNNTSTYDRDDSYVTMLRSIQHSPPPALPSHCLVALRIRATDQLNGTVQTFNAVAQALLPTWNPSTGWSQPVATSSPAWAMCEVLRGGANKRPLPDSRIDLNAFYNFDLWCAQKGYSYNACVDSTTTVRQLLIDIASVCRAILVMKNNMFSVVWDVPQTTPTQMFTPKNSWGFKYSKPFFTAPHALKCSFINPDKSWQQDQIIAYAPGYNISNATLFESVSYTGVTNSQQAWSMGMYTIACSIERPNTYKLQCDIEHLVCNRGDLVLVSHDVMQWGLGNGLVKSLTYDGGGNVLTITTDEQFTFNPGYTFVIRCRQSTGAIVLLTLVTPGTIVETNVLTLATPTPAGNCPAVGDLVAFGLVNQETVRLLVKGINRNGEFNAELTLVDEGPGVYTADTTAIAPFVPQSTWPMQGVNFVPPAPVVVSFLTDHTVMTEVSGAWLPGCQFTLQQSSAIAITYASLEIQYRLTGITAPWQSQFFTGRPTVATVTGITDATYYDFRLRYWGGNANTPGINGDWVEVDGIYIIGRSIPTPPPSMSVTYTNGIAVVGVTDPGDGTVDHWLLTISQPTSNTPQQGGVLTATTAVTFTGSSYSFPAPLAGTYTMTVQAVSWTGNVSTGLTDTLYNSAAWAANAIASTSIPTSGGSFSGTISIAAGGQIVRPSLRGVTWAGTPGTSHDEELFNDLNLMTSANISDIASTPVTWFTGPQFTSAGTWTSSIIDMGGTMTGLWWLDSLVETVDFSALSNYNQVSIASAGPADVADLVSIVPSVTISITVGTASNLAGATTFTGAWTGTGRYVQITFTAVDLSWVTETYLSNMVMHCDAPDILDGGTVTTTTNPQTINFNKTYHQPPVVTVSAVGSNAVNIVASSITSAHFQVACTVGTVVNWAAKGV